MRTAAAHSWSARVSARSHRKSTVSWDRARRASAAGAVAPFANSAATCRATSHSTTDPWMNPNRPSAVRTSRLPAPTACVTWCGDSRPSARPVRVSATSASSASRRNCSLLSHSRSASVPTACHKSSAVSPEGPCGVPDAARLVRQPGREDLAVEVGGADRRAGLRDGAEPLLGQVGDEAQHPRVGGQPEQLLDARQGVQPRVGGVLVAVPVDQVRADLAGGELLQPEDPAVRQHADPLAERGEHLRLRLEVLGPAYHDDLGLVLRGAQQRVEVVGGLVVGDPGDQLVEPVEQQHDAALPQHVVERLEVDQLLAVVGQVRGDQPVDRVRLVEGAQLDQDRDDVRQLGGDAAGQLAQRERLAAPEVAEQQQEPAVVGGQHPEHLADGVVPDVGVLARAVELAVALPDVQRRMGTGRPRRAARSARSRTPTGRAAPGTR